jgi:glycosyltransferase XagB
MKIITHRHSAESDFSRATPILPYDLIPSLIDRMSHDEISEFLQYKILPVAHLPSLTLYGTVNEIGEARAKEKGNRVVAKMLPHDFQRTVFHYLGKSLLLEAAHGLKKSNARYSAHRRFTPLQIFWAIFIFCISGFAITHFSTDTIVAVASLIFGFFFLSVISVRVLGLIHVNSQRPPKFKKQKDENLPSYSVLVPVFRETNVLKQLITALLKLNYPTQKLDIKIIVEEKDTNMRVALLDMDLPAQFEIIVVPEGKPQTKPRALNYALQFARGELLTIYDAEDIPDRNQLRLAAAQFAASSNKLACIQAELTFYNPNENWLTRQFTIEYAMLFKLALPSLAKEQLPLLLGGTSNHFRTHILRNIGAWDPFNVTEDADLGMRLARFGYRTSTLESTTYEEANIAFGNWLHQRSRWLKGFLQTWLVHMRHPRLTLARTGYVGFWIFQTNTIGIFISALFMPLFLGLTIYHIVTEGFCISISTATHQFICVLNLSVFILGYSISIAVGWRAMREKKIKGWWFELITMPIYWLMMTLAAWKALKEFIVSPFHWNKTEHGLSAFQKAHDEE